jgi:hypothetical protein
MIQATEYGGTRQMHLAAQVGHLVQGVHSSIGAT